MSAHWTDGYFGELYLDTVVDLLTPRLSALEAEVLWRLLALRPGDRVLDAGCGHGRHVWPLAARGARPAGVDRSHAYLRRGRDAAAPRPAGPAFVRGDVRALPVRPGAFAAAFSWYASLFMFDDETNARCLAELGRAVRPGGRILVHHANPARLALAPADASRRELRDGSRVEEESSYDAAAGVDRCSRRLVRPSGAVLAGTAELRYYSASEWGPLSQRAGLRILELTSTTTAGRFPAAVPGAEAPDLIALLEKPT